MLLPILSRRPVAGLILGGVLGFACSAQGAEGGSAAHNPPGRIFKASARLLATKPVDAKTAAKVLGSVDPANYAYVANSGNSSVSVIDTSSPTYALVATIPVGNNPASVVVNSNGTMAYVANSRSRNVSVISTASNTVTATVSVGRNPSAVTISTDNSKVYVANQRDNSVSVINSGTNKVTTTIPVGNSPVAIAFGSSSNSAYVANSSGNSVSVISAATGTVTATIPVGNNPSGIALNAAGTLAYVTNQNDNTVSVINTVSNTVTATITVGVNPIGVMVSNSGARVYVANNSDNTVSVIDGGSNNVLATVPVGNSPQGMALSPRQKRLYVTNVDDNTVSVIDTATNKQAYLDTVGNAPVSASMLSGAVTYAYIADGTTYNNPVYVVNTATMTLAGTVSGLTGSVDAVVANPAGTRVYARQSGSNSVAVIDTATNAFLTSVAVGKTPGNIVLDIAVTPDGSSVYTTNFSDGTVSVISTATNTVSATINTGGAPFAVASNARGGSAYASGCSGNNGTVWQLSTTAVIKSATGLTGCPQDLATSPDGKTLYVLTNNPDALSVLDAGTLVVKASIPITGMGFSPTNLAVSPAGDLVYASVTEPGGWTGSYVAIISTASQSVTGQIPAGMWPQGIALTPSGNQLIVTDTVTSFADPKRRKGAYNVIGIDTATQSRTGTLKLGTAPISVTTATVFPSN